MNNQVEVNSEDLSKKERKALRTKKIILEAGKELFSEKGFDFVTMEEIADLAALSRATLYNYFNTKEEIYFSIGISKLEDWIEQFKLLNVKEFTGEKLISYLTENLVKDILEFPLYSRLLRRFFYRSNELELPIQDLFYSSMVKRKEFQSSPGYKPQYKIFLELLEHYINYRQLWQKAINMGIKDGSITSTSNPIHLNFFLIMIIFGLLDQIDFRRYLMSMVNISNEEITGFILRLTNKFLAGEI
jgi:AcrR family transcriptional regulator